MAGRLAGTSRHALLFALTRQPIAAAEEQRFQSPSPLITEHG